MTPSNNSNDPGDNEATRNRIERFRAAVRAQAMGRENGPLLPMAISIHDIADSLEGEEAKKASRRFIRNTIMATALVGVGIWAASNVPSFLDASSRLIGRSASGVVKQEPAIDLRNVDYVMGNNLSHLTEDQVRQELNYVSLVYKGKTQKTLDVPSRLLLVKWASDNAGLTEVGLGWKDVYGVIHAESSWVAQTGASKSGVSNNGLAQFEGATAKNYGLTNANDPLSAIATAAKMLKDAAVWSEKRLENFQMNAVEKAMYLREGVSVYYNTGWTTRKKWSPERSSQLPVETKAHILNVQAGNFIAENLAQDLKSGAVIARPAITMEIDATNRASSLLDHLKTSKKLAKRDVSDDPLKRAEMAKRVALQASIDAMRKRSPVPS